MKRSITKDISTVHIRSVGNKNPHDVSAPLIGGVMQRRFAYSVWIIDLGAVFEVELNEVDIGPSLPRSRERFVCRLNGCDREQIRVNAVNSPSGDTGERFSIDNAFGTEQNS